MKQLLVLASSLALAGCAAIAPAVPTPAPVSTPQVIIQTVIVTVLVTVPASQTPIPTATWTPIPTFTPQPTSSTGTAGTPQATATGQTPVATLSSSTAGPTATLPANAGGGLFTNLTRSTDQFSVNCLPNDITLGVTTTDSSVTEVDLFYRLEDKLGSSMTGWVDIGAMTSAIAGNYTFDFKATMIPTDMRFRQAWFDYQFVGLNKSLRVIGRSATIVRQVSFSANCPS